MLAPNGPDCWKLDKGHPMTKGTLTTSNPGKSKALCETTLHCSGDTLGETTIEDKNDPCYGSPNWWGAETFGPVWKIPGKDGCPDAVLGAAAGHTGPNEWHPGTELEKDGGHHLGFGLSLELNTGKAGSGANHLSVYGRAPIYVTKCGNGELEAGEQCDDSDTKAGDGCSPTCTKEAPKNMVVVPAGPFWMGCNPESAPGAQCGSDETPQHEVTLDKFAIGRKEVTVDEHAECVNKTNQCTPPDPKYTYKADKRYNWGAPGRGNHPMNGLPFIYLTSYCSWRKERLPTEAEWEKAARGGCETVKGMFCKSGMRRHS